MRPVFALVIGPGISTTDLERLAREIGVEGKIFADSDALASQLVLVRKPDDEPSVVFIGVTTSPDPLAKLAHKLKKDADVETELFKALLLDDCNLGKNLNQLAGRLAILNINQNEKREAKFFFYSSLETLWYRLAEERYFMLERRIRGNQWDQVGVIPARSFFEAAKQIGLDIEEISPNEFVAELEKTGDGEEYNLSRYERISDLPRSD